MATEAPLRLSELTAKLENFFAGRFGGKTFWVIAEVSNHKFNPAKQWHFFDLIEKAKGADRLVAKMSAVAWRQAAPEIVRFESESGQKFTDGIEVLVQVELAFNGQYGLKLTLHNIDSAYTLGQMERRRREILARLVLRYPQFVEKRDDRYVTANQKHILPQIIRRVAVISSPSAAGYEDFIHTLNTNAFGYTFAVHNYFARVQGMEAADGITRRLCELTLQPHNYDLVVMIRGGGAQTDLFIFDDFALNRELARAAIPVWTGIGHQRDSTIADLFSHTSHKTPTRVAEAIIQHNRRAEERVALLRERLHTSARQGVKKKKEALSRAALLLASKAPELLKFRQRKVFDLNGRMRAVVKARFIGHRRDIQQVRMEISAASKQILSNQRHALQTVKRSLSSNARQQARLRADALARIKQQLRPAARRLLAKRGEQLAFSTSMVRMGNPELLLKKGYALIEVDGRIVASVDDRRVGDALTLRLHRHALRVEILEKRDRSPSEL